MPPNSAARRARFARNVMAMHLRLNVAPLMAVSGRCYLPASGSESRRIARLRGRGARNLPETKINSSVPLDVSQSRRGIMWLSLPGLILLADSLFEQAAVCAGIGAPAINADEILPIGIL